MADTGKLATLFCAHAGGEVRPGADLEAALREALAAGRGAWVGFELEADVFVPYLARRARPETDAVAEVRAMHAADLYLACACAGGRPEAIAVFDAWFSPVVRAAVARLGETGAFADEVIQTLRHKLLVADGDEPRIASYAGQGALASWVRVAATRAALSLLRKYGREVPADDDALLDGPATSASPELELLKREYRDEFRRAFYDAFASLDARARNLLRLYYVDGLNVEAIGVIYRVHASTVSRRIARARQNALDETRRLLGERLALPASEVDSLLVAVRSQMDVSLGSLLRSR